MQSRGFLNGIRYRVSIDTKTATRCLKGMGESMENNEHIEQNESSNIKGYKVVCAKLGLTMCIYFICRICAGWAAVMLRNQSGRFDDTVISLVHSLVVIILVYAIPIISAALLFKSFTTYKGNYRKLYKKPKRLARALGSFPATFGFGHGIALLTLLASFLISRYFSGHAYLEELIRPTVMEPATDIASMLALVFLLVVIAPVFEEFFTRGIMYDALKPYGTGMAILISSLLFGLMHGSLYMLFYTTAYGLALGYIRYATDSLFTVTILHAIVNSIGAVALLLSTLVQMTNEENRAINTMNIIYVIAVLIMIVIGIVVFISKIPAIRKFKIENSWTDVGPWKKTAWFFLSIPVIIMMVLAFNEISHFWLSGLILR